MRRRKARRRCREPTGSVDRACRGRHPRRFLFKSIFMKFAIAVAACRRGDACLRRRPAALRRDIAESAAPCLACHGENGQSETPKCLRSAGSPRPALCADPALSVPRKQREVEIMNEMTKSFTDDDLRAFSDFISRLPPPIAAGGRWRCRAPTTRRALITQHRCNSCHNLDCPAAKTFRVSPISARTISLRRCAKTRTTCGTATTAPWPRCSRPSTTRRYVAYYIARFR